MLSRYEAVALKCSLHIINFIVFLITGTYLFTDFLIQVLISAAIIKSASSSPEADRQARMVHRMTLLSIHSKNSRSH